MLYHPLCLCVLPRGLYRIFLSHLLTSEIELVLLARVEPLGTAQDEFCRQPTREARQAEEGGLGRILLKRVKGH